MTAAEFDTLPCNAELELVDGPRGEEGSGARAVDIDRDGRCQRRLEEGRIEGADVLPGLSVPVAPLFPPGGDE